MSFSPAVSKKGRYVQVMKVAELGQEPALPEYYKFPPLLPHSPQPASCAVQPKATRKLLMFAVASPPKHMDFRIMRTGDVYAAQ